MTQHLTDAIIKRLPAPDRDNKVYYDSDQPGFGVRVTAKGHRSFILNYTTRAAGRERRYTIGTFPSWGTVGARIEAHRLRRLIEAGGDPLGKIEEQRDAPTVADLCKRFEEEHLPRKRLSTQQSYARQIRKHVRPYLGAHTKVADVSFADIDTLHRKITREAGPYVANRTMAMLSKMFSLAIRWQMRTDNPAKGIERNVEQKRKRYLSGDELARLTKALAECPDKQSADIIRTILLTGCRKGEALGMRWSEVDLGAGVWTKLGSTTKQKSDHVAPLSAPVRQLLAEIREQQTAQRRGLPEYVFASTDSRTHHRIDVDKTWRRLLRSAGISQLRIHDLRHSFASQLASGGASLPLIGALLGHSNPTTTARYAHLFQDPQRAAVEKVAAAITAAGNGNAGGKIEPFPAKRGRRGHQ
jgi:integrase